MKRKGTHFLNYTPVDRVPFDVLKDIDADRLAAFASVVLSWNLVEAMIDASIGAALELQPDMWSAITSRINGVEGKLELLKETARVRHRFPERDYNVVADTIGQIMTYKRYRDGLVHARIFDATAVIAPSHERRGKTFEVLVSKDAIEILYEHMDQLCCECAEMAMLFFSSARCLGNISKALSEDEKQAAAEEFRAGIVLLLDLQSQRAALRPLPKFPPEPQAPEELEVPEEHQD